MPEKQAVNLLLVDDKPNNLMALSAILDRPDYHLMTATSGKDALALLAREEVALVLLDVMMPEMDGFEVASRMKQDERTRLIPILFVTAVAKDLKDIYKGYAVGGVDYIQKPLDSEVVRAKVSVFVELFRKTRELETKDEFIRNSERAQFLVREQAARLRSEEAERRFRNLVNALDHAIIWEATLDLSKITFISERVESLLGYPHEEWLREPGFFFNHVHPDDRPLLLQTIQTTLTERSDGLGNRCEHRVFAANGEVRWLHTGLQEERDGKGTPLRLRGLCVDISPLKKVEQELREAVQAKDEIVSVVAHDLRNPLSAADLSTAMLIKSAESGDLASVKQHAGRLKNAIGSTIKLADDILDSEKAQSGRLAVELHEENAADLINSVVEVLSPLALEKSIRIQVDTGVVPCMVRCDRSRIRQVLSNLIGNAIKFTPAHGTIWASADLRGDGAVFSVRDTGPGIASEHVPHIFERFWQTDEARNRGLGLGLAISKGIVEAHGGAIWVESTPSQGSTFYVRLPKAA